MAAVQLTSGFNSGPCLVLVGPTAVGKTEAAMQLALEFDLEIVSVDSMQVYRLMDIGTAKPSAEERQRVPHHLLDIVWPDESYDAGCFVRDAHAICREIRQRGRIPLLTGGTGLYLRAWRDGLAVIPEVDPIIWRAVQEEMAAGGQEQLYRELRRQDPRTAARLHPNDRQRLMRAVAIGRGGAATWSACLQQQAQEGRGPAGPLLQIGLTCEREVLYHRIALRCHLMLLQGLREEVAGLLEMGYGAQLKAMQAIGYRHMVAQLLGLCPADETEEMFIRDSRRYAKRQLTWFRREQIDWVDRGDRDGLLRRVDQWLHHR